MSNPGNPGQGKVPRLRYPGLGTLAMRNAGKPGQGKAPRLGHPGLGTLAMSNPDVKASDSWARYLGLGTLA